MYLIIKRFFDILLSGLCLLLLSPLLIPIMIGLRLTGEGHVFFLQRRVGYGKIEFDIYKFATMLKDSANMPGGYLTTLKDPRITPLGGFLRKSKINELPQLLNIFLGEMSFVGPRPVMPVSFSAYPKEVQDEIYNVKPGLSGIGSIVFRDEEVLITNVRNSGKDPSEFYINQIYPFKGQLEYWYQRNQNFILDFKIILATIIVVVFPNLDVVSIFFRQLPKRNF